jgi:hypothetical protein
MDVKEGTDHEDLEDNCCDRFIDFAVLGSSCTVALLWVPGRTDYGAKKGALIGTGVGAAAGAIYDITK